MQFDLDELNAHTPRKGEDKWHKLSSHLLVVARLAARFARAFDAEQFAYLSGLWHDVGKVNPAFQSYLETLNEGKHAKKTPHAVWGAALAYEIFHQRSNDPERWKELAIPIAAHHTDLQHPGTLAQKLHEFLTKPPNSDALLLMREFLKHIPIARMTLPAIRQPYRRDLFIRILFSCLVDADYLDTEKHFSATKAAARSDWTRPADLWHIFRPDQLRVMWNGRGSSVVNNVRRQVYRDCVRGAKHSPGFFRLTVPTGGGKTRSSLAFALRHAVEHPDHNFRRIIVALPYTSIIDQTASEYRDIFGYRLVLEHHSQIDVPPGEEQDEKHIRHQLTSENWDHPLIVTTTVQLFESLFHNKPSRCRKLHNIAHSILILDEIQTLPPELLRPTLDVLRTLVEDYRVTVVLSSATQPAFEDTSRLLEFQGIKVYEIVPNHADHFRELKRVQYEREPQALEWSSVAERIREQKQVMVVLNSRKDALELLHALDEVPGLFHLSTLLCGAHRRKILSDIRARLSPATPPHELKPVRLIATQVVEAGVDMDFPEVWRAMGPMERIVQAAGRCNREGRLEKGRVVIFEPADGRMPRGSYKLGFEKARLLLEDRDPQELHRPELHREYFHRLHSDADDKKASQIQQARHDLDFPSVAKEYRLIKDNTVPVVVDYEQGFERLNEWRRSPNREKWRQLQPYVVSLYEYEAQGFLSDGWMDQVTEKGNLYRWLGEYNDLLGIRANLDITDLVR